MTGILFLTGWTSPQSYVRNDDVYRCTEVPEKSRGFGRALDNHLVGKRYTVVPPYAVMLFETGALGRNVVMNVAGIAYRHGKSEKRSLVSFSDGHAKAVDMATTLPEAP